MNNAHGQNYIIGILGRKGSGKSELCKKVVLPKIKRYMIFDVLHEYTQGVICDSAADSISYIDHYRDHDFKLIFRPPDGLEEEEKQKMFLVINTINNYTLVMEEVDQHCNPNFIQPELLRLIKYGRHYNRSLVWLSRNAAEVNRSLTRQSDLLITFHQQEPIDLKYLSHFSLQKAPETLEKYEYTMSLSEHKCIELFGFTGGRAEK